MRATRRGGHRIALRTLGQRFTQARLGQQHRRRVGQRVGRAKYRIGTLAGRERYRQLGVGGRELPDRAQIEGLHIGGRCDLESFKGIGRLARHVDAHRDLASARDVVFDHAADGAQDRHRDVRDVDQGPACEGRRQRVVQRTYLGRAAQEHERPQHANLQTRPRQHFRRGQLVQPAFDGCQARFAHPLIGPAFEGLGGDRETTRADGVIHRLLEMFASQIPLHGATVQFEDLVRAAPRQLTRKVGGEQGVNLEPLIVARQRS